MDKIWQITLASKTQSGKNTATLKFTVISSRARISIIDLASRQDHWELVLTVMQHELNRINAFVKV